MNEEFPQPLVSIIISNYNYGRYLAEAIDSALNQDYSPIEVLVVDDGSTDESRGIIEGYGDRIIAIMKENGGQGTCFNVGFERSLGEIIIFLDSDDFLFPNAVSRIAERMRNPAVSKCNGYLEIVDGDSVPTGRRLPDQLSPSGHYKELVLAYGPGIYVSCFTSGNAWKRSFLSQVIPIPITNRHMGSDGYLTAVDALFGDIETIEETIGGYRIHGSNFFPTTRQFKAEKLALLLNCADEQMRYTADVATKLGYQVDCETWKAGSWYILLVSYCLALLDPTHERPGFMSLVAAPFKRDTGFFKQLKASLALVFIQLMPKPIALELSRRALKFSAA